VVRDAADAHVLAAGESGAHVFAGSADDELADGESGLVVTGQAVPVASDEAATWTSQLPDAAKGRAIGKPAAAESDHATPRPVTIRTSRREREGRCSQPDEQIPTPARLHAHRNRPKHHDAKVAISVLRIILGGWAGLALGQLILWWMPGGLRSDPLRLAPALPGALAFLAPASLRNPPPPRGESITTTDAVSDVIDPEDGTAVVGFSPDPRQANGSATRSDNDSNSNALPYDVRLGLPSANPSSLVDVQESLHRARSASERISASPAVTRELAEPWYTSLCELATTVTFADPSLPGMESAVADASEFFRDIASQPDRLRLVAGGGAWRLNRPSADRQGIVLAGTVREISVAGRLFRTQLRLLDEAKSLVSVISRIDPRHNSRVVISPGDGVIVLGSVIDSPSLYLVGYEGSESRVVWGGLPIVVPSS
jgi:hypothetical protein